jgi:hypothetical protein
MVPNATPLFSSTRFSFGNLPLGIKNVVALLKIAAYGDTSQSEKQSELLRAALLGAHVKWAVVPRAVKRMEIGPALN